jgi:hypothetical protein
MRPGVFISHVNEQRQLAMQLRTCLLECFGESIEVFVASESVTPGQRWLDRIEAELRSAKVVLVLCSDLSIARPWVNFEAGGGWMAGINIIPVCCAGLRAEDLPQPFALLQEARVDSPIAMERLINSIRSETGLSHNLTRAAQAIDQLVSLESKLAAERSDRSIIQQTGLALRTDLSFEHVSHFYAGAKEIFVSAISHGYLVSSGLHTLEQLLLKGSSFRIVLVDEGLPDDAFRIIAEHDERDDPAFLKAEIARAKRQFEALRTLPGRTGHMEVKAARGIPDSTVTILDPGTAKGRIKIEFRPYKRNNGPRPWLELHRSKRSDRAWYDLYYESYYVRLWNDARPILAF